MIGEPNPGKPNTDFSHLITFTVDLEDPTEIYAPNGRYVLLTDKILDLFQEHAVRATFFVVGRLAEAAPALIEKIARQGHEIAYHSRSHVSLTDENPRRFMQECKDDKSRLEQLSQRPVLGYRAPRFSLTAKTVWAIEILGDKGFQYSSSVMPTVFSRFGMPKVSCEPFFWHNGLYEFPMPVISKFPLKPPFLGGIYLYALPAWVTRLGLQNVTDKQWLWTYLHPYDLDREEAFVPFPHTARWISYVLYLARSQAENSIRMLLNEEHAPPLGDRLKLLKTMSG